MLVESGASQSVVAFGVAPLIFDHPTANPAEKREHAAGADKRDSAPASHS